MQVDQTLIIHALNSAGAEIRRVQSVVDMYRGFAARASGGKAVFDRTALSLERELRIFVSTGRLSR